LLESNGPSVEDVDRGNNCEAPYHRVTMLTR
jgi:hypothetical protein